MQDIGSERGCVWVQKESTGEVFVTNTILRVGGVAQVVECLSSKHEVLSSSSIVGKKKKTNTTLKNKAYFKK
jgi:hypothetical protein